MRGTRFPETWWGWAGALGFATALTLLFWFGSSPDERQRPRFVVVFAGIWLISLIQFGRWFIARRPRADSSGLKGPSAEAEKDDEGTR